VLHPNQFQVNEAWTAFRLNDAPVRTESDGDFNLFALIDAASCFILSTTLVTLSASEPSKMDVRRLLRQGRAHKQQLPKTLFVPKGRPAKFLTTEAERQGIAIFGPLRSCAVRAGVASKPANQQRERLVLKAWSERTGVRPNPAVNPGVPSASLLSSLGCQRFDSIPRRAGAPVTCIVRRHDQPKTGRTHSH
jgi:hypothetical protein